MSGGRSKASILANAVEAVIGAVYLDGGFGGGLAASCCDILDDRIEQAAAGPGAEDFKTRLQEVVLRRIGELPRYEVEGTGPDHARRYTARVLVAGAERRRGRGPVQEGRRAGRARRAAWAVLARDERVGRAQADRRRPSSEGCGAVPELPEVETIRRDLDKEVVTRRIKTVEVKGKRSIRRHKSGTEFRTRLEGKRVASIRRAGKYLLVGSRR